MKDQINILLKRQKLQDEEQKSSIKPQEVTKLELLKESKMPILPNEPVFLGQEEIGGQKFSTKTISDKDKFNRLVSEKVVSNIQFYKTNMIVTLPLEPIINHITYYKTNMIVEI